MRIAAVKNVNNIPSIHRHTLVSPAAAKQTTSRKDDTTEGLYNFINRIQAKNNH